MIKQYISYVAELINCLLLEEHIRTVGSCDIQISYSHEIRERVLGGRGNENLLALCEGKCSFGNTGHFIDSFAK